MKSRDLVIGCIVAFAGLVLLLAVGGFLAYRFWIAPNISSLTTMPAGLNTPGVVTGSGLLTKNTFFADPTLETISDIRMGELDPDPGVEIGVAGAKGAVFLSPSAKVKSSVVFGGTMRHVEIMDVEGDGKCEFLNCGGWGSDVTLIDHKGKPRWTYGRFPGVNDTCAGDVDGDGRLEFVVGFNGSGGVHLLDEKGAKRWQQPDSNVWHVEVMDTNNDGRLEIVHSNAAGQLTVRDSAGVVLSRARPSAYVASFSLCKWPSKAGASHVLSADNGTIWVFDANGIPKARFDAPACAMLGEARGTPVRLEPNKPECFAVLVAFRNWNRSALYLYDSSGKLAYQEVLDQACESIFALPLAGSPGEMLLVGGNGTVWQYKPAPTAPSE